MRDDFFVFVAVADNKVVGGLTAYTLQQYYSVSPLVFIYDIAIRTDAQRQGVGKRLISHLTNYCKDNNFEEMFVLVSEKITNECLFLFLIFNSKPSAIIFCSVS